MLSIVLINAKITANYELSVDCQGLKWKIYACKFTKAILLIRNLNVQIIKKYNS